MHGIPLGDTSIGLSVAVSLGMNRPSPRFPGAAPQLFGLRSSSDFSAFLHRPKMRHLRPLPTFGPSVSCPTYYALCGLLEGAMKPYDSSCPSRDSRPGLPG